MKGRENMRRNPAMIFLAVLGCLGGISTAGAQLQVTLIVTGTRPTETTGDVRCVRFATTVAESKVWRGMPLLLFDELSCDRGDLQLEVADAFRAYRLSSPFRAVVTADNLGNPRLDIRSGLADAQATRPSGLGSGLVSLGANGTMYSIRVGRDSAEKIIQDCLVYDGDVTASWVDGADTVKAGEFVRIVSGSKSRRDTLEGPEIRTASERFARLDLARAIAGGVDHEDAGRVLPALTTRYREVLTRPDDASARVDLAVSQVSLGLAGEALYHLDRPSTRAAREVPDLGGRIAAARNEAHLQRGETDAADGVVREYQREFPGRGLPTTAGDPSALQLRRERSALPDLDPTDLEDLLGRRDVRAVRIALDERIARGSDNPRDFLGAALAAGKLDNEEAATWNARMALEANEAAPSLSVEELRTATEMAR
ncbi:MAG: hypothetical protein FD129_1868, partial [bacterium]